MHPPPAAVQVCASERNDGPQLTVPSLTASTSAGTCVASYRGNEILPSTTTAAEALGSLSHVRRHLQQQQPAVTAGGPSAPQLDAIAQPRQPLVSLQEQRLRQQQQWELLRSQEQQQRMNVANRYSNPAAAVPAAVPAAPVGRGPPSQPGRMPIARGVQPPSQVAQPQPEPTPIGSTTVADNTAAAQQLQQQQVVLTPPPPVKQPFLPLVSQQQQVVTPPPPVKQPFLPLVSQQQQQQQAPILGTATSSSSGASGGVCAAFDTQLPGSSLVQSYGLKMVQSDKLPSLPPPSQVSSTEMIVRDKNLQSGVLVCIASSGLDAASAALADSSMYGCVEEHPLDPGGCPYAWDRDATGQGTHLAAIVAGAVPGRSNKQQALGVFPGAELHSVRIWDKGASAQGAAGDGVFAKDRLLAYTACEGKLRGLQATHFYRTNYRMVMLVDVQAPEPANATFADPKIEVYPSELDWFKSAAAFNDDIIWVAPAGDSPTAPAYPAALAPSVGNRLLSVGAVDCRGKRWPAGVNSTVDLLAPGVDIAAVVPAPDGRATAVLVATAGRGGRKESVTLDVVVAGDARGRPETDVALALCKADGSCPSGGKSEVCVLSVSGDKAGRATCDILTGGGCKGGVVLVGDGGSALPPADAVVRETDGCGQAYAAAVAGGDGGGRSSSVPVMLAADDAGARLLALMRQGKATGKLQLSPPDKQVRTGTPQAAAFVAGGAARLMARFALCSASEVASAMIDTAALLSANGKPTGGRGRGGLVQLAAAEKQLEGRPCSKLKLPTVTPNIRALGLLNNPQIMSLMTQVYGPGGS